MRPRLLVLRSGMNQKIVRPREPAAFVKFCPVRRPNGEVLNWSAAQGDEQDPCRSSGTHLRAAVIPTHGGYSRGVDV